VSHPPATPSRFSPPERAYDGYVFDCDGDMGSMDWQTGLHTHTPDEVLRPQTEQQRIRRYFRFHSVTPENRE